MTDRTHMEPPDGRYTVTKEWTGQPAPVWVARFCGELLGWHYRETDAIALTWRAYSDHMWGGIDAA